MTCAWDQFIRILPQRMRQDVDRLGQQTLQEFRLRINAPPELVCRTGISWLSEQVTTEDLQYCINAASRYSPWAAETAAEGYLTAPGGHRIGLCGDVVIHNGIVTGIRRLESICIRIARDFPGIGRNVDLTGSVLILGAPGWGKTTLLRDLARNAAARESTAVVDERGELFPPGLQRGKRMDVLTGCPKEQGIRRLLCTMGPEWIVVDEITADRDCEALTNAVGCGVKLLATAHGSSREDLTRRSVYRKLMESGIFSTVLVLDRNKGWKTERMNKCL